MIPMFCAIFNNGNITANCEKWLRWENFLSITWWNYLALNKSWDDDAKLKLWIVMNWNCKIISVNHHYIQTESTRISNKERRRINSLNQNINSDDLFCSTQVKTHLPCPFSSPFSIQWTQKKVSHALKTTSRELRDRVWKAMKFCRVCSYFFLHFRHVEISSSAITIAA